MSECCSPSSLPCQAGRPSRVRCCRGLEVLSRACRVEGGVRWWRGPVPGGA